MQVMWLVGICSQELKNGVCDDSIKAGVYANTITHVGECSHANYM